MARLLGNESKKIVDYHYDNHFALKLSDQEKRADGGTPKTCTAPLPHGPRAQGDHHSGWTYAATSQSCAHARDRPSQDVDARDLFETAHKAIAPMWQPGAYIRSCELSSVIVAAQKVLTHMAR
jgi:hypothetical protein